MKIMQGDFYELVKQIPDKSVDLILTDPPYNIAQYSQGNIPLKNRKPVNNDIAEWDLVELDLVTIADEFRRILDKNGNIFVFSGFYLFGEWVKLFNERFDRVNFMIWHKTNPTINVKKRSFLSSCEQIVCAWDKTHSWNFLGQNQMHNFIESPICRGKERTEHPTQKPLKILEKLIFIGSDRGDVVFDGFMGSGSTGVAALRHGRDFIGFEIDPHYFSIARRRLEAVSEKFSAKGRSVF